MELGPYCKRLSIKAECGRKIWDKRKWKGGPEVRMMKQEAIMTTRDDVHQLVDTLPEDRLADALDYLAELNDTDEVDAENKAAIEEGLDDIRNGRTITLEEYRRTRDL